MSATQTAHDMYHYDINMPQNKKVCYRWLHSVLCMKREMRILLLGVGAFRPNFIGTGSSPAKMLIPFDR